MLLKIHLCPWWIDVGCLMFSFWRGLTGSPYLSPPPAIGPTPWSIRGFSLVPSHHICQWVFSQFPLPHVWDFVLGKLAKCLNCSPDMGNGVWAVTITGLEARSPVLRLVFWLNRLNNASDFLPLSVSKFRISYMYMYVCLFATYAYPMCILNMSNLLLCTIFIHLIYELFNVCAGNLLCRSVHILIMDMLTWTDIILATIIMSYESVDVHAGFYKR